LSLTVYGVLRSGEWGWVRPRPGAPSFLGVSPVVWLISAGLLILFGFILWESHLIATGREPLVRPPMLRNRQLAGGLTMFFFQFFVQAGLFFTIPLFLSVVLELSAVQTGARLLPLSLALLVTALGVPRIFPAARPRLVVRIGLLSLVIGVFILIAGIDPGANAGIVTIPLLFMGLGVGALASQLGAVTVSAVDESESSEVGGIQNTVTNLGASMGTALVGAVLIASLTATLAHGIESNTTIPPDVKTSATVEMASGVPFISDTDLQKQLSAAGVPQSTADAIVAENSKARLQALRDALWIVALAALLALFFTPLVPVVSPGRRKETPVRPAARGDPVDAGP